MRSITLVLLLITCVFGCDTQPAPSNPQDLLAHVDPFAPDGPLLPTQQRITPAGRQVELPGMRPQALCLSPDGRLLATSGMTHELVLIDPVKGAVVQRVALPPEANGKQRHEPVSSHNLQPDAEGQLSYTGLTFSPDGSRIYMSNVWGSIKVFAVDKDGKVTAITSFALPETGLSYQRKEVPAGLAVSADGRRLYVAANVSNRLLELDASTGAVLRSFDVGNAPFDVRLTHGKAYVSNWGGRRADGSGPEGPIGQGARVRVDPVRYIASEGSATVIDLSAGRVIKELPTGLHASSLALSPDEHYLAVANANSDTVSIIDTSSDTVVETISVRSQSTDLFGASPDALCFDAAGKRLYVCNGTQNAIAVITFEPGKSKLVGLIPAGWFPGAIVHDSSRNAIYVASIKGIGSGRRPAPGRPARMNVRQYFGTLSLIRLPDEHELVSMTQNVLQNDRIRIAQAALLPPRSDVPARPVPQRAGEPSVFKHVVYVIKENRTYDQVLGDMTEGNGDPDLAIFGEEVTPNQHKICREFVLLDNTYCAGINSAEGHQWADSGIATDYIERSYAGFPRSYPDGMEDHDVDALAYASSGFIWDSVLARGKTLRDYGEFTISTDGWADPHRKGEPEFLDYYNDFANKTSLTHVSSRPAIASLRDRLETQTVGWDLKVPDVVRADRFIRELHEFEHGAGHGQDARATGGFPNLSIICLPNDHTSGTRAKAPTPAAQVADNDLAFGRIVEAISHSGFWRETCIIAIEDDPQNGFDHVSAYRTTAYVISPYTKRHTVVHNNYNQPGLLHTIELILGLPPMNQLDAMAAPMTDCFTDTPDFTPYDAVPNRIPLDRLNPMPSAIADPVQRQFAVTSAGLPLQAPDKCPEDLLNRILWNAQRGSNVPYPQHAATPPGNARDDDD